jgi:hypothetical protein
MNDNSAHMSSDPSDVVMDQNQQQTTQATSYVDEYQPPVMPSATPAVEEPVSNDSVKSSDDVPAMVEENIEEKVGEKVVPIESSESSESSPTKPTNPVENKQSTNTSETLEDQNIFSMLGVEDGTEELKENFLNELQEVIWDDFLENDVNLLITSDEKVKFDEIMSKKEANEEVQDALVAYLETLIPDLEDIMLEKALDLKADLFAERIIGMKEYYANSPENLKLVNDAEKMMHEDKWHSSTKVLNSIDTRQE